MGKGIWHGDFLDSQLHIQGYSQILSVHRHSKGSLARIRGKIWVSNGPMVYHYKERLHLLQGTDSVRGYFNRLKKLGNELGCLVSTPSCSCGAAKEIANLYQRDHLMQFLMGLDESLRRDQEPNPEDGAPTECIQGICYCAASRKTKRDKVSLMEIPHKIWLCR
ncbi:UNVERIFIED_CONTAM: hypothetical protein Slati_2773200 [Sesamum latifolium]|uniref:Retrotransposon protein n=1 Tax=Sesamum latifolium TaxID=2727402 RepID=A0AAW2VXL5_9LAMI